MDALTQWFDIGPTVLELAGLQPPPQMEAQSLLPHLEGAADAPRAATSTPSTRPT